jgi:hypothetical protein
VGDRDQSSRIFIAALHQRALIADLRLQPVGLWTRRRRDFALVTAEAETQRRTPPILS